MADSDVPDIQIKSVGKTVCPRCGMMVDVSGMWAFASARCAACGTVFAAPGKLGQYVLLNPVSHSATAVSFKGFDTSMSRHVEVKVMLKELCGDVARVRLFQAEARALASLDNRSVARAFFVGEEAGRPYAVSELIEGKALSKLISPDKPLSEIRTLTIALDVAGVLRDLEAKGLCHARIAPDNIILTSRTTLKVVNFGAESDTAAAAADAAPHYLAPEQIRGQGADFRTDVYALGATMFCALTGSPPFDGETAEDVRQAHLAPGTPDLQRVRQGIGGQTAAVVARALRPVAADRYDSVDALLVDLRSALSAAETAKLARKGDAVAALSTMTDGASSGESSAVPSHRARRKAPAKGKAGLRTKAGTRAEAPASPSGPGGATVLNKRNLAIGAVVLAVAIATAVTLLVVLRPPPSSAPVSPKKAGGESFTGDGAETSASGPGLVAIRGFDMPGWSVNCDAEFNDGALDLSNGKGGGRSISREVSPGAFAVEIDLKNIALGAGKNCEVRIAESGGLAVTFSVRGGEMVAGVHVPDRGWRPVAERVRAPADSVSWKLALAAGKDGPVWTASWRSGKAKGELALGKFNIAHFSIYAKALRLDAPRTLAIVSSGRSARVSVDHYRQTGGSQ